jgi:hypothetical protein
MGVDCGRVAQHDLAPSRYNLQNKCHGDTPSSGGFKGDPDIECYGTMPICSKRGASEAGYHVLFSESECVVSG